MASTYTPIATYTVSGTSTSIVTFSSISGTYTDLLIIGKLGSRTTDAFPYLQFNSDTGSNYSYTQAYGNGTDDLSGRQSNISKLFNNDVWVKQNLLNSNVAYHIMNYSNTTTWKTSLARQNTVEGGGYPGSLAAVGLWRNTAAITSVDIQLTNSGNNYNFFAGSIFTLYGIKAA